jgi:GntR family transcriptional regulator of arabinose operon
VQPGGKFHSENQLCELFGFSRQTVRRAFEELENQGYLTRSKGSGTYISENLPAIALASPPQKNLYKNVGIITTFLDAYIFPSIIQSIETVLTENGYTVQFTSTKNFVEGELRALETMYDVNLDGMLVWPTKSGLPCINQNLYKKLADKGVPIIFVDSYYTDVPGNYVAIDDEGVGKTATNHLIDMGHKKIIGLFPHGDRQGYLRYTGYLKALIEAGIPVRDEYVHWYSKEDVEEELEIPHLWKNLNECTAAFCFNDSIALSLIDHLEKKGLSVPNDFSVIGVDSTSLGKRSGLTSLVHPGSEVGKAAANLLISVINGQEARNITFEPQLIIRDSVKRIEV